MRSKTGKLLENSNDILVEILGRIIAELLVIAGATYAYNHWLALPLGLPIVTYFQVALIRVIWAFFSQKLL